MSRGRPGRGGGRSVYVQAPDEWRASSVQACGLWPFSAGSGGPMIGVPIGRNLLSGATVCADPLSWFERARLISSPSMWVQGTVGLGKSALVKRIALGLAGYGVNPLVLGDLKGEYLDLTRALGGQVIEIGRGRGSLNVLDASEAMIAADRLTGQARAQVIAEARGRRQTSVSALLTILRGHPLDDAEEQLLGAAIGILDDRHAGTPLVADLIRVIDEAPDGLRALTRDRGDIDRYHDATDALAKSLTGLAGGGQLGNVFATATSTPMLRGRPVAFDLSSIDDSDTALQGAALVACWAYGFGAVNVSNALADAGVERQRPTLCLLDEAWKAIRSGRNMVDKIDALTRLNRQRGVATIMVTHSLRDLEALADKHDVAKAKGFIERSGVIAVAGVPEAELALLEGAVGLSQAERDMIVGWQTPPVWDATSDGSPPGRGNFMLKAGSGGRPGIPVHVQLTDTELALTDTDKRWRTVKR